MVLVHMYQERSFQCRELQLDVLVCFLLVLIGIQSEASTKLAPPIAFDSIVS